MILEVSFGNRFFRVLSTWLPRALGIEPWRAVARILRCVQCKYGPLMCVARRLLHPKGAPIRSPLDSRGEAPKGSIFSAHGLAWRRRVRIFYARDSRPHQRVQLFGSEWSPHLSRGVSTTDQNSLEPSICKGASIRSPLLTTCRGYARPKIANPMSHAR